MSRDMGQVGWHRLSKRLTMRDVAEQAGWCDDQTGEVRRSDARRALRWLSRIGERSGVVVLFGEPSGERWTTMAALRQASPSLVEEDKADAELVAELEDGFLGVSIRLRSLRAAVAENRRRIEALEAVASDR